MSDWRRTFRTVATTFAVTSAGWIIAGAVWLNDMRPAAVPVLAPNDASVSEPAPPRMPVPYPAATPSALLLIPVQGVPAAALVDTFTQARAGGARVHDAIDIMAPRGRPVLAAAEGRVEKLFLSVAGGKTIYIRSPDGKLMYYYAHLDSYRPGLAEGQQVARGQVLGTVGFTGNANPDGPHLHFAVMQTTPDANWSKGVAINPYPLLTGRRTVGGAG